MSHHVAMAKQTQPSAAAVKCCSSREMTMKWEVDCMGDRLNRCMYMNWI